MKPLNNKTLFYILSWTWGFFMTFIGAVVFAVLMLFGKKPKKHGLCYYIEIGENWGGLELGMFFLTEKDTSDHVKNHEHGHAIQNCYWGPLMPFVICIPSAIRYWYRELKYNRKGLTPPTEYDDIWFEGQASRWGEIVVKKEK